MNTRQICLTLTLLLSMFPTVLVTLGNAALEADAVAATKDSVSPSKPTRAVIQAAKPTAKPKPKFQYQSEGIEVPTSDPRIQKGVLWLKQNQRVSGRWWMKSLYKDTYHHITYISTVQALHALALCGEVPKLTDN